MQLSAVELPGQEAPHATGRNNAWLQEKVRRGVQHALAMGTLPLRNIAIELTRGQFPRVASGATGESADGSADDSANGGKTNTTSESRLPSSSDPLTPTDQSV